MPRSYAFTKKAKLEKYLMDNPGFYRARNLAIKFKLSSSYVATTLSEFILNRPYWIEKRGQGRTVTYLVKDLNKGK